MQPLKKGSSIWVGQSLGFQVDHRLNLSLHVSVLAASCLASLRFIRLQRAKHAVGSLVSSRRPKAELVRFIIVKYTFF